MTSKNSPDHPPTIHAHSGALDVVSFGLSHTGCVRTSNEDSFLIAELARNLNVLQTNIPQPASRSSSHRVHVFLVADGVGGSKAGEVASALSVVTVEDLLLNAFRRLTMLQPGEENAVLKDLRATLFKADARIVREAAQHPEWQGMASTLTMALAVNRQLIVAHAGDCRCYLFSHGRLQQITTDHTLAAELEQQGLITPCESGDHPWRHVVSNLLGGTDKGVRTELHSLELHDGDAVVLCSDGLSEMVSNDRIVEMLKEIADPREAACALVADANNRGGRDNVTVIVARFVEPHIDQAA